MLLLMPRARATLHLWQRLNLFRGHRIWRHMVRKPGQWFFHDKFLFCECGKEFK